MRTIRSILLGLALAWSGGAQAAPVTSDIQVGVLIQGLDSINITLTGVVLDVTGTTVTLPGATATGLGIVIPVTASTAINNINASTLGIQGGTFSVGGVTAQAPGEVCGVTVPAGQACNVGGGIGGLMGLTGTINVSIVPMIVVIPVNLNNALVGQGGSTNTPFTFDAAGWTTGTARVNTGATTISTNGQAVAPFVLVSPTFLSALGNLLPIFTTVVVTNSSVAVPEASGLLLVLSGIAGLVALGVGRRNE